MENSMVDSGTTTTRWRGLNSIKALTSKLNNNGNIKKPVLQERESDLAAYDDVDISLIQTRTYLLSAGIGDTNKQYNKYKGKIGLLVWCINIVIHFSLDFYEAWTIFGTAWATCIGLFFVTLVACCISMIRNSIPWFLRGVKKLKKDGHYPKTLSRVRLLVRFMPFATLAFAVGAAAGQFGCYAADNALRVNFNRNNNTIVVPQSVEILINILRATSLIHIFYGFASLLLFHMTLVFMIQSSMKEYNDRMGKLFREVPINIQFSDAVNLFSARAKFVRDGSQKCSVVLTTLLVACCTSFVLNAYNFLFLAKHAIYIWFALAPLIWAVTPLMGAAWITKTYWQYKLVVVNAWVDVPDEHELEAQAHAAIHQSHTDNTKQKAPVKTMWGSIAGKLGKRESDGMIHKSNGDVKDGQLTEQKAKSSEDPSTRSNDGVEDRKISSGNSLAWRRKSEVPQSTSPKHTAKNNKRSSLSVELSTKPTPTIMFSDYDGENTKSSSQRKFRPFSRKISDSSLSDLLDHAPGQEVAVDVHENQSVVSDNVQDSTQDARDRTPQFNHVSKEVRIDIDSPQETRLPETGLHENQQGSQSSLSGSSSSLRSSLDKPSMKAEGTNVKRGSLEGSNLTEGTFNRPLEGTDSTEEHILSGQTGSQMGSSMTSLKVPGTVNDAEAKSKGPNMLSGISKTFHKWRTKTKKKKRFNYEKYIIYLESILPTVGFSIGGVIIDWNGIYTFIVIMTFMVGVFAQEAFFGT